MYLLCLLLIVHSEGCKIHKNKVFAVLSTGVFQPLLSNSNCLLIHSSTVWDHYFMLPFPSNTFQSFCIFTFCSSTMLLISLIKVTVFGRELPPSPAVTPAHRPASAPSTRLPWMNQLLQWTTRALICNQSFHLYFDAVAPSPSGMSSLADMIPSLSCLVNFSVPAGPPLFLHLKKHSLDPAFLTNCHCLSLLLFAAKLLRVPSLSPFPVLLSSLKHTHIRSLTCHTTKTALVKSLITSTVLPPKVNFLSLSDLTNSSSWQIYLSLFLTLW